MSFKRVIFKSNVIRKASATFHRKDLWEEGSDSSFALFVKLYITIGEGIARAINQYTNIR